MTTNSENLMLGKSVDLPTSPAVAELQSVPAPDFTQTDYVVRFSVPEFTSLCPVTGQPDFAHFMIDYIPDGLLLESKSLKLFMASFRNHRGFHEECTVMIGERINYAAQPKWMRVGGYWFPRGGIPIDVFYEKGKRPPGLWIPDQRVPTFRGR